VKKGFFVFVFDELNLLVRRYSQLGESGLKQGLI
jgi:hypothetical protein